MTALRFSLAAVALGITLAACGADGPTAPARSPGHRVAPDAADSTQTTNTTPSEPVPPPPTGGGGATQITGSGA